MSFSFLETKFSLHGRDTYTFSTHLMISYSSCTFQQLEKDYPMVKEVSKNRIKGEMFSCSPTFSALKGSFAEEKRRVTYTLSVCGSFQVPPRKEIDSLANRHHNFLSIYNFPENFE